MRIALFIDSFPKFSETFILNQIGGLLKYGHEVVIFPRGASGETLKHPLVREYALLDRTRFPSPPGGSLAGRIWHRSRVLGLSLAHPVAVARLRQWYGHYRPMDRWRQALAEVQPLVREGGRFDILFAHFGPNGLRAAWYRRAGLVSGPLVTVFHGYDLTDYLRRRGEDVYRPLWDDGDLFLPISRFWCERLHKLGCPPDRIDVHHVGIDCAQFAYQPRRRHADAPVFLISVARLVEKKGIEFAIRAVARLVASGLDLRYRIIGDGPLADDLRGLAEGLGIGGYVEFLGVKTSDEVADELGRAHIMLAPSVTSESGDMEGIPTVLMEAMASGLPVVSTLHSGIPELVEDGVSGRLVPERDDQRLAVVLRELIGAADSWSELGHAGRQKVLAEFDMDTLNRRLVDRFRSLTNTGRGYSGSLAGPR